MLQHAEFSKECLFGIQFDVLTMTQAVDWVFRSVALGYHQRTRYVVTPNVNLTMRHQDCSEFRRIVHEADLTIVDGSPIVTASRLLGKPLPERVAGSDLVEELFRAAIPEAPLRVFLLGAAPGVADRAAQAVTTRYPGIRIVGTLSPVQGFESDADANDAIIRIVNSTRPDVLVVGLGAPKQEAWTNQHRNQLQVPVTLCVGGTIDFMAGEQIRAPRWVRQCGVEWFWRMATNPRRLMGRYFRDALRLPKLFLDEVAGRCPVYDSTAQDSNREASEDNREPQRKRGGSVT